MSPRCKTPRSWLSSPPACVPDPPLRSDAALLLRPAHDLAGHQLPLLPVREVADAIEQAPLVDAGDKAARSLGRRRQYYGIAAAVQMQCRRADGLAHLGAEPVSVQAEHAADTPSECLYGTERGLRDLHRIAAAPLIRREVARPRPGRPGPLT